MSKYYKVEDVIDTLAEQWHFEATIDCPYAADNIEEWKQNARELYADLPTIEIVRCKDCKYWKSEHICIGRWGWYGTMMTEADAFCSYGERIDNE